MDRHLLARGPGAPRQLPRAQGGQPQNWQPLSFSELCLPREPMGADREPQSLKIGSVLKTLILLWGSNLF